MSHSTLSQEDIDLILLNSEESFKLLSGKNIFISGATGFFGKWLIQSLTFANLKMNLNLRLHLLSRDWSHYLKENPNSVDLSFTFLHTGDIVNFQFPEPCEIIIHAANDARPENTNPSIQQFNKTVEIGSQRILEFAQFSQSQKILLTSSGAVYGRQSPTANKFDELLSEKKPIDFYGLAKDKQEKHFYNYQQNNISTDVLVARCFAFVGPYLPLDKGYAIGNFINNALRNEPIKITGDHQAQRSYLYMADLMIWLTNILMRAKNYQCYNVGSDQAISIQNLAQKVSLVAQTTSEIHILSKEDNNQSSSHYVPNIEKAKNELNLKVFTPLDLAIKKTLNWYQDRIG